MDNCSEHVASKVNDFLIKKIELSIHNCCLPLIFYFNWEDNLKYLIRNSYLLEVKCFNLKILRTQSIKLLYEIY